MKKRKRIIYQELMPSFALNRIRANRIDRIEEIKRYKQIEQEEKYQKEVFYFGGY